MNIAEQIKAFHIEINAENGSESVKDYDAFVAECEEKAGDIDQDWDTETTTYEFMDGSVIVLNNSDVHTYGAKQ